MSNLNADISNVINVQLIPEGTAISRDNMNIVALLTSERGKVLSTASRYREYKNASSVAEDFGTSSAAYEFAQSVFAQQPNAVNAGGSLVIGYFRAAQEEVAETATVLKGGQITEATVVSTLQQIADGSLEITIDGTDETLSDLDLRTVTKIEDIVKVLSDGLDGKANVTYADNCFMIEVATSAMATLSFAKPAPTGTFIGNILAISEGSGAVVIEGKPSETLAPETPVDAVQALKSQVNFKGLTVIDSLNDGVRLQLANWVSSNNVLIYEVFNSDANFEVDADNIVWKIKLAGLKNFRMLYSKNSNRKMAAAYMSMMHSVNFNGENTAKTMQLKTLTGIVAEPFSQSEISSAQTVGLDIYTSVKNVPCLLTSGANDFTDNVYNLIALVDSVQTDAFNLLKTSGTKIPQTTRGVNQLVNAVEMTLGGYVRAGVLAPGEWTSPDFFGDVDVLKRSVATRGFYVLAGDLADQPQSDRQARKSPVIQAAIKNAGAIHSADIVINFNY